jgi:hypothetical protein
MSKSAAAFTVSGLSTTAAQNFDYICVDQN